MHPVLAIHTICSNVYIFVKEVLGCSCKQQPKICVPDVVHVIYQAHVNNMEGVKIKE